MADPTSTPCRPHIERVLRPSAKVEVADVDAPVSSVSTVATVKDLKLSRITVGDYPGGPRGCHTFALEPHDGAIVSHGVHDDAVIRGCLGSAFQQGVHLGLPPFGFENDVGIAMALNAGGMHPAPTSTAASGQTASRVIAKGAMEQLGSRHMSMLGLPGD